MLRSIASATSTSSLPRVVVVGVMVTVVGSVVAPHSVQHRTVVFANTPAPTTATTVVMAVIDAVVVATAPTAATALLTGDGRCVL